MTYRAIASICFRSLRYIQSLVSNLSCRGDGGKMLLLSAWNTTMQESNATATLQQRSHPMIILRSDPDVSVPGADVIFKQMSNKRGSHRWK